jgi:hypothetical protein
VKPIVTRQHSWTRVGVFLPATLLCATLLAPLGRCEPPQAQNTGADQTTKLSDPVAQLEEKKGKVAWESLVGKWEPCEFGGDGPIEITGKLITVGYGDPLTGVRWKDSFPKENYEIEVEAQRTDGFDFFCALTFPVGDTHCTLVMGGWGGGVMGLSNVDGYDASDNPTTQFRVFDDDKWYRARVRVTSDKIVCWIDDKQVIEQERKDHEFGIRYEMDPCVPLGLAAYQCDAEYRNPRWRHVDNSNDDKLEVSEK